MPDLLTAIENALNKTKEKQMNKTVQVSSNTLKPILEGWDKEEAQRFAPKQPATKTETPVISKETFYMVRDNAGITRSDAVTRLAQRGFKPMTTSSLISQMVRGGQVTIDADGGLHTKLSTYTPIKNNAQLDKMGLKKVRSAKNKQGIAALSANNNINKVRAYVANKEQKATIASDFDADKLLSTLSFTQTMELYRKIQKLLGEK